MNLALVLVFSSSVLALYLGRFPRLRYLLLLPLLAALGSLCSQLAALELPFIEASKPSVSSFGFRYALIGDGLSLLLGILVLGIGVLIQLYTLAYFKKPRDTARFSSHLQLFMGAMLGVVTSANLLLLFVFWELTSVSSYLLIAFKHEKPEARAAALQAFLVTGVGGLCLLAGFLILGHSAGTFELIELQNMGQALALHPNYTLFTGLIFLGALTKSAQFPFHFWLPNAMQAPTPASSYLHSATMVKAGIFLLMRLFPILGGTVFWSTTLQWAGGLTLLIASVLALLQFDMKKILAYTTLAALAILTILLGIGTPLALQAALLFTLAHALYKAPLFLIVGNVDHECGSRDVRELSGVRQLMPKTFWALVLCCIGLASLPPFFSFIAKELALEAARMDTLLMALIGASGAVFVFIACLLVFKVFGGKLKAKGHEAPWPMVVAPLLMALFALALSIFPEHSLLKVVLSKATSVLVSGEALATANELHLSYWHGVNLPLVVSLLAIVAGAVLFKVWPTKQALVERLQKKLVWGPSKVYDFLFKAVMTYPKSIFGIFQHGYLNYYLMTLVVFVLFLFKLALGGFEMTVYWDFGELNFFELFMAGAIVAGAFLALRSESSLAALTALGLVGFGVAFLYLINGAPDLALTQFLVETLTLVLLVLSFRVLPKTYEKPETPYSMLIATIAGLFALCISYFTLYAAQTPARASIRDFFGDNSFLIAKGKNVVNVILVDFRALDTMGEVAVLCIAAVGVYTLLRWNKKEMA